MTQLTLEKQNEYLEQFRNASMTIEEDVDVAAFQEATAPTCGAASRSGRPGCTAPSRRSWPSEGGRRPAA